MGPLLHSMVLTKVIIGCLHLGVILHLCRHPKGVSSGFSLQLGRTLPTLEAFP